MLNLGNVVFEDGRDVSLRDISICLSCRAISLCKCKASYLWEVALRVADQQTGLAAAAIADDDELLAVLWRGRDVGSGARGGVDGVVAAARASPVAVVAGDEGLGAVLAMQMVVILDGLHRHGDGGGLCNSLSLWNEYRTRRGDLKVWNGECLTGSGHLD